MQQINYILLFWGSDIDEDILIYICSKKIVLTDHDFSDSHNIRMLSFEQRVDFSQRRNRKSFFFFLHFQSFKCYDVIRPFITCSVHHTVCAFLDSIKTLEFFDGTTTLNIKEIYTIENNFWESDSFYVTPGFAPKILCRPQNIFSFTVDWI